MKMNQFDALNDVVLAGKSMETVKQDIYELWQECFGDSKAYTDFYLNWKVKDNQVLSVYKEDKISAMLHLNPYTVMVKGQEIKTNYIVGVATRKQDRRQGLMKRLLERALLLMYEEHMPFTYLMPAAEAIYYPYDFRIVYEQVPWRQLILDAMKKQRKLAESPLAEISAATIKKEDLLEVRQLKNNNIVMIEDLVEFSNKQLNKSYAIYVVRNSYYYKRLLAEMESCNGGILLCYQKENLIGYTAYMAEGDIQIAEAIYIPEKEDEVIKEFARRMPEITEEVEQKVVSPPTIMVRVVDFLAFAKMFTAKEELNITIKVSDPILTQNNGIYSLEISAKGCEVTKTQKKPEIEGDIAEITRLLFGMLPEKEQKELICTKESGITLEKLNRINYYYPIFINDVV